MEQQSVVTRQVTGSEPVEEPVVLPYAAAPANEGKTVAGWTLMYVCGLGAAIVAIGIVLTAIAAIVVGVAVIVVGLVLSAVLRALGHGQPRIDKRSDTLA